MTKTRFRKWHLPFLLLLIVGTWVIMNQEKHKDENAPYQHNEGMIFGTTYHTTYQSEDDLQDSIVAVLQQVDNSLSMFNPMSTISRINSGKSNQADSLLETVFNLACGVSQITDGAFDVTVAPLVNAWGFGFKNDKYPDEAEIDSLKQLIGWNRVHLENGKMTKEDPRMIMDFSAIAKGFGSDCVANFFKRKGIKNYMIEIGGEVVTGGLNPKHDSWRIGINKPEDDSTSTQNDVQQIVQISDCAMATSGNYRNFYLHDGKKIAHTIDPKTGYPVQHSILSSTVLAPTCGMADAFATSFMVMGMEKAKEILQKNPQLQAYLIYSDEKGQYQVWYSKGLKQYFVE